MLGTKFNGILREIHTFSFTKISLKMSSGKWRLFRLGLKVLNQCDEDQLVNLALYLDHCKWDAMQQNIQFQERFCLRFGSISGHFGLCISGWSVMFWARVTHVDASTKYILTGGAQTIASHGVAIGVHGSVFMVSVSIPPSEAGIIYNMATVVIVWKLTTRYLKVFVCHSHDLIHFSGNSPVWYV